MKSMLSAVSVSRLNAAVRRGLGVALGAMLLVQCSSGDGGRGKRERKPPPVADSTMPWNRPAKWEGSGRFGQMMQGSR